MRGHVVDSGGTASNFPVDWQLSDDDMPLIHRLTTDTYLRH